jgi:hypothetical protein
MNIFGALFVVTRQDHTRGRCLAYVAVTSEPIFMNCPFDIVIAELDFRYKPNAGYMHPCPVVKMSKDAFLFTAELAVNLCVSSLNDELTFLALPLIFNGLTVTVLVNTVLTKRTDNNCEVLLQANTALLFVLFLYN